MGNEGYIIIPARDEEKNIGGVIEGLMNLHLFKKDQIFIVNNGSKDNTAGVARDLGAQVVEEPKLGYGNACLAGIAKVPDSAEWILIMDADGSDDPNDILKLVDCFHDSKADLVIGSRTLGKPEEGSLSFIQRFGNSLTCFLILIFYRLRFTDLGPMRVIRWKSLKKLNLQDRTWGWNIEMHIRAIQCEMILLEIPVNYRRRKFGVSKISGTIWMASRVGCKILYTFFKLTLFKRQS